MKSSKYSRPVWPIVIIVLLGIAIAIGAIKWCSREKKEGTAVENKTETQAGKTSILQLDLIAVEIDPQEPTVADFVRVLPQLKDKNLKFVTFTYHWTVNGEPINQEESLLDKQYYKKGDIVSCKVTAKRGPLVSEIVSSPEVKIGNAPPIIDNLPSESFRIPGRFVYNIQARDPDGDTLSYHLVSPTDQGIYLDESTGTITWDINDFPESYQEEQELRPEDESGKPAEQPETIDQSSHIPSQVRIVYEVRDNDGAVTASAIVLNLSKESAGEIPQ